MESEVKKEFREIVELVKECPEVIQLRAFEILLEDYLRRRIASDSIDIQRKRNESGEGSEDLKKKSDRSEHVSGVSAITVPMRLRAFLKKNELDLSRLDRIFHVEAGEVEPIWEIQSTKTSQAQIEVSLFCALQRALEKGEFAFEKEEVRELCEQKGVHPKNNFNANYSNNSTLFTGLEKGGSVSLSAEGMSRLAELIRGNGDEQ